MPWPLLEPNHVGNVVGCNRIQRNQIECNGIHRNISNQFELGPMGTSILLVVLQFIIFPTKVGPLELGERAVCHVSRER